MRRNESRQLQKSEQDTPTCEVNKYDEKQTRSRIASSQREENAA